MGSSLRALMSASLVAMAGAAAAPVFAHGGNQHGQPGPVVKEQKPWGIAGDPASARRVIRVTMGDDMRFVPDRIEVKAGETVRFMIRNTGQLLHEFVIGTKQANQEHAELMLKFPNMEHDEPYMAHVQPGKTQEVVWTFNRPGEFEFACLIAGHYQAGMVGTISVAVVTGRNPGQLRR